MTEQLTPLQPAHHPPNFNFSNSSDTIVGNDPEIQLKKEDQNTSSTEDAYFTDYPEGSLKAYLVVMGSFMGLIPCFGLLNILGVIESFVNEHQLAHVNSSTVGWVFSIFTFLQYTTCIFSGTYFDQSGATAPLITGSVLLVSGLIATASCTTLYQFIMAFGVLTSLGNGTIMSPLIAVISHYFYKKRAFYCSVATLGGSVGGVIFPLMLRELYPKLGFEWSMRILALICAACLSVSIVFAKERKFGPPKEKLPVKVQLKAYFYSFDFKALKDPRFFFCVLGSVFAEISAVSSITYFASYSKTRGFSISDSYILVTLVNAGTLPGRFVTGYLADRFGRYNVFIITVLLTAVVNLAVWMPFGYNFDAMYAYSVLYGVFSGAVFSLLPVCCGQVCKTEDYGKRYSTMYFIIAFGTLFGVPVGGAIIGDKSVERYNYFIIYTAVTAVLSAGCYIVSRYYCIGKKVFARF